MNLQGCCFLGLLLLHVAIAVPVLSENLVRDKRKIENETEKPKEEPVVIPADLVKDSAKKLEITEIPVEEGETQERVKKQTFYKMPCGKSCGPDQLKSNIPDVVFLKPDEVLAPTMEMKPMPMKAARTIEPIYSFGPVSVNGAAGSYGSHSSQGAHDSYGSHGSSYSYQQAKPVSSYSSSSSYAAPAGMQFHAVIPYMVHRPAVSQHSYSHAVQAPVQVKPEISYYFENPEPVYVENEEHGEGHAQQSSASPVSLYCQSMKSKDLIKALAPVVEVKPSAPHDETADHAVQVHTVDHSDDHAEPAQDHIQRVNEIKEEITQLNQAAQRIVDQQEKLAKMQQAHMEAVGRNADPELMARSYPTRIPRPFHFRANEDTASSKENQQPLKDEMQTRQGFYYPSPYDSYYGYRSAAPFLPMYETGFPVYKSSPEKSQDDVEFFMKMLDMGKRMGVLSKDFQPSLQTPMKKEETPKEDLLTDLTFGEKINDATPDAKKANFEEGKVDEVKVVPTKKDKRGLLPKKA